MRVSMIGVALALGALMGCSNDDGRRSNRDPYRQEPESYDDIVLDDVQQRKLLLSTDPGYGPDHVVMVSVRIPEAYYADGAVHLSGGREIHLVPPHAWNTYSGSALTASEAAEVIARAGAIDAASEEYLAGIRQLRALLEEQAVAVEDAKADAYRRAELRRSERHLARSQEELSQLQQQREQFEEQIDREAQRLDQETARLRQRRAAVEEERAAVVEAIAELKAQVAELESLRDQVPTSEPPSEAPTDEPSAPATDAAAAE